ncbi:hypothetical protein BD408DRAFT_395182 [Parasitella parasitica]|nr:hypothetical protein BD408DRAFT_395182 [Parasitella parasitica]
MKFSKVFKTKPIQRFELTVASGTGKNVIAFGPASIINGSVKLFLDKPIRAKSITAVFSCQEWDQDQEPTKILSVESIIWSQNAYEVLEKGSHIYLFAIQLPSSVNYPPTIRDSYLGHRIEYTLQGHLDFTLDNKAHKQKSTASVPLTYLPLVTFDDRMNQFATRNRCIKLEQGSEYVQITASFVNPSSCPGDLCSIKLHTHNRSSYSINQVHIILVSTATSLKDNNKHPDLPISSGPSYQHKQRQILNESFYVSIPKHTDDITTICPFIVPSFCVPTTQSHFGKYIDITYEVFIIVPAMGSSWEGCTTSQLFLNAQAVRLPLFITTMPYCSTEPPKLQIPFANEDNADVPSFIIHESPIPSPSPSPSPEEGWMPGSPVDPDDDLCLLQTHEDASGHLMVPPIVSPSTSPRRSFSTSSSAA